MKKELQKEFEALVRGQMEEFYTNAFSVAGDREAAECLTQESLIWAAEKFAGLASKARVCDLIGERIGEGERGGYEPTDTDAIFLRAMEKLRAKRKKKGIFMSVCAGIAVLALGFGIVWSVLPKNEEPPIDTEGEETEEILMKDAETIEGDTEALTLVNYHNVSQTLNEKTTGFDDDDIHSKLERHLATLTAPDGTRYMAFTHIPEEKVSENNTVTLYRMEKDGWKPLGTCETQMHFGTSIKAGDFFYASRIYMTADADSNVYLFCLLEESIAVYRYDREAEILEKQSASLYIRYKPMIGYTFSIDRDTESGLFYIGYCDQYKISFAYYDIERDEFVSLDYAKKIGKSNSRKIFRVSGGVIHLLEEADGDLLYSRIEADGTVKKTTLLEKKGGQTHESVLQGEYIVNRGRGQGGMAVNESGVVHIIATRYDESSVNLVHYRISEDMNAEKEMLTKLFYVGSDEYNAVCGGVFTDGGDIYYIEAYRTNALQNVFAVGKLSESLGDAPKRIDVFEVPENITRGFMRVEGKTAVFYSDDDIYYFDLKGIGG